MIYWWPKFNFSLILFFKFYAGNFKMWTLILFYFSHFTLWNFKMWTKYILLMHPIAVSKYNSLLSTHMMLSLINNVAIWSLPVNCGLSDVVWCKDFMAVTRLNVWNYMSGGPWKESVIWCHPLAPAICCGPREVHHCMEQPPQNMRENNRWYNGDTIVLTWPSGSGRNYGIISIILVLEIALSSITL